MSSLFKWELHFPTKVTTNFISLQSKLFSILFEGRSLISYQDVTTLLRASENPKFISLMLSTSCLVTIAETKNDRDILSLFEIMNKLIVTVKYLFIETPVLNYYLLHNKTINYKVFINHNCKGTSV